MAIVRVQVSYQINSTNIPVSPTLAGSLIVICPEMSPKTANVTSVTDDQSNTYFQVPSVKAIDTTNDITTDIWYSNNSNAGVTSVTLHGTGVVSSVIAVSEYSGVKLTSPLDVASKLDNQAGSPVGASLTTTNTQDMLISILGGDSNTITGVQVPWSDLVLPGAGADGAVADYIPGSIGTFSPAWNPTTSDHFCSSSAAFFSSSNLFTLSLADSVGVSDSFATLTSYFLLLTESLTPADALTKQPQKVLNDFIFRLDDIDAHITAVGFNDQIHLNDWLTIENKPPSSHFGN